MRIGGIASGMDTEQMVSELMKVERMRVDRLFQQEQRLKWRQEAYNDINKSLANFILDSQKNFGLKTTTNSGTLVSKSVQSLDWVKKVTSSNESALKVSGNAGAMLGSHTVEIHQLADVARHTIDVDDVEGLKEIVGDTLTLTSGKGDKAVSVDINLNDVSSMSDLVKKINNATVEKDGKTVSLGLRAAFDKDIGSGQLMISSKETGEENSIDINYEDPDSELITIQESKDAIITFNGTKVKKSTNNFSIYGINLQLQDVTVTKGENGAPDKIESIKLSVSSDVDSIFDQVKSFVDEYNKIIDDINGQLGQKYYRDFQPLTNEEKAAMTEKDIELWEEKSKSGLIKNDGNLTRMLQTMRTQLYEKVEGVNGSYNHITQIGITTGRYQDGGKLVIDEEKLKNAINDDPEGVMDLLFKVPDGSVADEEKFQNTGLVQRIYDTMVDGMKEIITKSGPGEDAALLRNVRSNILIDFVTKQSSISLLDKDLSNINKRIAREESMLLKREDSYWQRFTAMEKAMASMQQQSMWLMSQMGLQ